MKIKSQKKVTKIDLRTRINDFRIMKYRNSQKEQPMTAG